MSQVEQRAMYSFRSQDWVEVFEALEDLVNAKAKLLASGAPGLEPMLNRAGLVYKTAKDLAGSDDALRLVEKELIRFLDIEMITYFLAHPEDKKVRDELDMEIILLAAATDNDPDLWGSEPYSIDELNAIMLGLNNIYEDSLFVYSLRQILASNGSREFAELLFYSLPATRGETNKTEFSWWDDAFIFTLILQTVWHLFPYLDFAEQQFLLQNYFYQSVMLGVPARKRLSEVLVKVNDLEQRATLSKFYFAAVSDSKESVPLDVETLDMEKFTELLKVAMGKSLQDELDVLALDKFVNELYAGKENTESLAAWLKEVLGITTHLRKADLF